MPFPGERLAPRGNKRSWEPVTTKKVEEFDMRVRTFTNGGQDRVDIEITEGAHKRRIHTADVKLNMGEAYGDGFVNGYAVGRSELKPLTPQPKTKAGKKVEKPKLTLKTATREQLLEALLSAVKDMGNPEWDDAEVEGNALGYVKKPT